MAKKILIIGYGIMTKGIIKNLYQTNNYELLLYSRHVEYIENVSLVDKDELTGAICCAEFVITCFSNYDDLESFMKNILLPIKSIYGTTVIDLTTSRIDYVEKFKQCIESRKGYFVEAPVTGSKVGSESGQLSIFLHMEEILYYRKDLVQLLSSISKKIYYFENSTEPTKFKLIYNSWGAYLLYSIHLFNPTKFDFSKKSLEVAKSIVCNDGWMSLVCNSKLDQINNQNFDDIHFRIEYMVKDLEYANFSVFDHKLKEVDYLLKEYKKAALNNPGMDYTVIGKESDE